MTLEEHVYAKKEARSMTVEAAVTIQAVVTRPQAVVANNTTIDATAIVETAIVTDITIGVTIHEVINPIATPAMEANVRRAAPTQKVTRITDAMIAVKIITAVVILQTRVKIRRTPDKHIICSKTVLVHVHARAQTAAAVVVLVREADHDRKVVRRVIVHNDMTTTLKTTLLLSSQNRATA